MFWVMSVAIRVSRLLDDGDRASLLMLSSLHRQLQLLAALRQLTPKYSKMDFPQFSYSPLRPQTTIAIDQVNTTNSDTHPNVKISIVLNFVNNHETSLLFIIPGSGDIAKVKSQKSKVKSQK
jgi:hypothetical protein